MREVSYKILASVIFLITILAACGPSQQKVFDLTIEEHLALEKFFRKFMLHETAIYTLAGSKPMTSIQLLYEEVAEEELREQEREDRPYFLLNRGSKNDLKFYDKLSNYEKKEKAYLIEERDFIYDTEDLWDKWEQIQSRLQLKLKKKYILVKKPWIGERWKLIFPGCKAAYDVFFVNVLRTATVIQENYDLFKQVIGYDFDPLEAVLELENEVSDFWDKLRKEDGWRHCQLWGILYGFGRENSFSYIWKGRHIKDPDRSTREKLWSESINPISSCKVRPSFSEKGAFTISNFTIPMFMSFVENDPTVLKYEQERDKIKGLYRGNDFVNFTLHLLIDSND